MLHVFADMSPVIVGLVFLVALVAGMVKGLVGFAMPMVMIAGLSSVMSPELALGALIIPTLVTNGMQAFRQGLSAALASVYRFRAFLMIGFVCLVLSAQMVRVLPQDTLLMLIGIPITGFALFQLLGPELKLNAHSTRVELGVGAFAGLIGGFSGVWGPPTVAYLTALGTEKTEQMRVQGVIYGAGAVALFFAHIASGVLNTSTAPLSVVLVIPAVAGMWIGSRLQDGIDQRRFRLATLTVLVIAGLNLIYQGVIMS